MGRLTEKLTKRIDLIYKDKTVEIQNKARSLFFVLIAGMVLFPLGILLNVLEHDYYAAIGEGVILLAIVISTILLFKNKMKQAAFFILIAALAMGAVVVFLSKDGAESIKETINPYDGMRLVAYLMPTVFAAALFARKLLELVILAALSVASMVIVFFLRVYPAVLMQGGGAKEAFSDVLAPGMLMILCYVFAYYIMASNKKIVETIDKQKEVATHRLDKLTAVIDSAKSGIDVGSHLNDAAEKSVGISHDIDSSMTRIATIYSELDTLIKRTEETFDNLDSVSSSVKNDVFSQTAAVNQSSASIEEMTASIRHMSGTAQSRKNLLKELESAENEGMEKMKALFGAFELIQSSADEMLNVVKVISDVAGRTNLLAMNASIEAAHAGDAGKGFSVVAQEIRNLAEETNRNSRIIKDIIQKNIDEVDSVLVMNKESLQLFEVISAKIQELSAAMNEIFTGMVQLSEGTSEINSSVENLLTLNTNVNQSVSDMIDSVKDGSQSVSEIAGASTQISSELSSISERSGVMSGEAEKMKAIGQQNIQNIKVLEKSLADLQEKA
jgi:methyl-accepting chemotaxis protein